MKKWTYILPDGRKYTLLDPDIQTVEELTEIIQGKWPGAKVVPA